MKTRTQRSYQDRIARVLAVILADPAADHSVERLAATAAMSPFHFHRIYRAITGEGVAETVRRVRLARAARALGELRESVLGAALDAGYDSPQAFSRAFRQFSGHSPTDFQSNWKGVADVGGARSASHVTIVEIPPARALCLKHQGPVETIAHTYRRLAGLLHGRLPPSSQPIGVSVGDPEGGDSFRYHAGVVIDGARPDVPGLTLLHLRGGRYAAYRLVGPYGLITPTYRMLFGGWLPHSGHELDDRPALEFYRSPLSWRGRSDCVTDLMIPIKE